MLPKFQSIASCKNESSSPHADDVSVLSAELLSPSSGVESNVINAVDAAYDSSSAW